MADSEASTASSQEPNEAASISPLSSQVSVEEESNASSFDADDDSDTEACIIKQSLDNCLDKVQTAGSFATSGVLPDATLSGLSVRNVGSIGFPLQQGQAKAIIDTCHQAPFGQRHRTVVDESVRKTWQLNPDQFELRNSKWPSVVQKVTDQVAQELGCTEAASVSAQLYKLLLYEEGAMFKPHKDTEKAPGMFGTLVICLPSEFEGGAVVASHRRESKVFNNASPFDHTYIAWYADVTHEVKAVTSGHRLVLTYNLIDLSQGLQRSASMLTREKSMLKGIISSWARGVKKPATEAPNFLAYKLDHEYTDASLKFQTLKGLDKVKAQYLREVCAEANAGFYLASMERTIEGSCEEDYIGYSRQERYQTQEMHTIEDVIEESIELKRMIDLDGSVLARGISIDETDIVQRDPFERDPDREEFEGHTGNEGASATHFYHDTVAVLVPFSSLPQFLSKHVQAGVVDMNSWCKRLLKKVQENPSDEASRQELYYLVVLINQTPLRAQPRTIQELRRSYHPLGEDYFPTPEAQWPIEASITLEDQALFEMAIESTKSLSGSTFKYIGKAIFRFDLPTTHAPINHLLSRLRSFHAQYKAFESVVAGYEAEANGEAQGGALRQGGPVMLCQIERWAEETCMHKLQSVDTVDREDGLHLAELAVEQAGRKPLREYLHIAKPLSKFTAFTVAFATHILRGANLERDYLADDAFEVFRELIVGLLPTFSVECRSEAKRGRSNSDSALSPVKCLANVDDVANLLVQLDERDLEPELLMLTKNLGRDAGIVDIVALESFFLPLLEALSVMVRWTSARVIRYGKLFRTTLSMYATRFVQTEPQEGNWTTTPQGCGCSLCRQLDDFLVNASQQSMRFPVTKGRRQHLHQQLDGTRIRHVTDRRGVETLVVTKPSTSSLAKHEQWRKRFEKAEEQIKKFDQEILKQLLGDEYESLTELRGTRRGDQGFHGARVAGRRQGHEIIDLT